MLIFPFILLILLATTAASPVSAPRTLTALEFSGTGPSATKSSRVRLPNEAELQQPRAPLAFFPKSEVDPTLDAPSSYGENGLTEVVNGYSGSTTERKLKVLKPLLYLDHFNPLESKEGVNRVELNHLRNQNPEENAPLPYRSKELIEEEFTWLDLPQATNPKLTLSPRPEKNDYFAKALRLSIPEPQVTKLPPLTPPPSSAIEVMPLPPLTPPSQSPRRGQPDKPRLASFAVSTTPYSDPSLINHRSTTPLFSGSSRDIYIGRHYFNLKIRRPGTPREGAEPRLFTPGKVPPSSLPEPEPLTERYPPSRPLVDPAELEQGYSLRPHDPSPIAPKEPIQDSERVTEEVEEGDAVSAVPVEPPHVSQGTEEQGPEGAIGDTQERIEEEVLLPPSTPLVTDSPPPKPYPAQERIIKVQEPSTPVPWVRSDRSQWNANSPSFKPERPDPALKPFANWRHSPFPLFGHKKPVGPLVDDDKTKDEGPKEVPLPDPVPLERWDTRPAFLPSLNSPSTPARSSDPFSVSHGPPIARVDEFHAKGDADETVDTVIRNRPSAWNREQYKLGAAPPGDTSMESGSGPKKHANSWIGAVVLVGIATILL